MKINWIQYTEAYKQTWDTFVGQAKNSHFLFYRDYMEYHQERFHDHSLLCFVGERLVGVLPGNQVDQTFYSHQGLTFGGFLVNEKMHAALMLSICQSLCEHLKCRGFNQLVYKLIPHIYHKKPCEEDQYALFRCGATVSRLEATTTINYHSPGKLSSQRRRGAKKALASHVAYSESQDWATFWIILKHRLQVKHHTKPTHTVDEIKNLAYAFPENIKLFVAKVDQTILGGVVIYETDTVAHVQYIAASDQGLEVGVLDGLFQTLILQYAEQKRWFDFGISTESQGKILNEGLVHQKEQFGGSTIAHSILTINW